MVAGAVPDCINTTSGKNDGCDGFADTNRVAGAVREVSAGALVVSLTAACVGSGLCPLYLILAGVVAPLAGTCVALLRIATGMDSKKARVDLDTDINISGTPTPGSNQEPDEDGPVVPPPVGPVKGPPTQPLPWTNW